VFVTLEGIEGSGKSTLLDGLADRLRKTGAEPLVTREPGGTPIGDAVRHLLLSGEFEMAPMTESLLMNASRAELVARCIRPALEAGRIVLCDRYTDSSLAYQGYGRGLDLPMVRLLCLAATGGLEPDVTLLLDIPVERSSARLEVREDLNRLDRVGPEFYERARRGYLEMAKAGGRWHVLDAALPPADLLDRAWSIVRERIEAPA
jgi:dTMP kinase